MCTRYLEQTKLEAVHGEVPCEVALKGDITNEDFERCVNQPYATGTFAYCNKTNATEFAERIQAWYDCVSSAAEQLNNTALCTKIGWQTGWCWDVLYEQKTREPCEDIKDPWWHDNCIWKRIDRTQNEYDCANLEKPGASDYCVVDRILAFYNQCTPNCSEESISQKRTICGIVKKQPYVNVCNSILRLASIRSGTNGNSTH